MDNVRNDNGIKGTLTEFFFMSNAEKIYQFSIYPWGSGFSDQCSKLYDIPIINCKILNVKFILGSFAFFSTGTQCSKLYDIPLLIVKYNESPDFIFIEYKILQKPNY